MIRNEILSSHHQQTFCHNWHTLAYRGKEHTYVLIYISHHRQLDGHKSYIASEDCQEFESSLVHHRFCTQAQGLLFGNRIYQNPSWYIREQKNFFNVFTHNP